MMSAGPPPRLFALYLRLSTVGRGEQIVRYKLAHLYIDIFHRMGPRGANGLCFLSRCDKTHGVRACVPNASRRCRVRLR
jgi:hypothetical protein